MINNLKATKRDSKTAGELNSLRSKGLVPAILYGGTNPNIKISVEEKLLNKVLNSESFLSTILAVYCFDVPEFLVSGVYMNQSDCGGCNTMIADTSEDNSITSLLNIL